MSKFEKTPKQKDAIKLLAGPERHNMLYGGSRSGKSLIICYAMIVRASKVQSRHLATRLKFNHAKTSLWYETFPKVFSLAFPDIGVKENRSDWFYKFPNGSEIWIGGLDEKERVEKILGKEYSTIFFNECSQIPKSSIDIAMTRLAEKNDLKNKAYYDENPPSRRHWSYPLFIKGLDPETYEPRKDAKNYAHMMINPVDNLINIDQEYIEMLEALPEKQRLRFMEGEFTDDDSGIIYYAFNRENNVGDYKRNNLMPVMIGCDFNVNPMTAVAFQWINNVMYIIDEFFIMSSNTDELALEIKARYGTGLTIIPDSTGKRTQSSSSGLSDHQILRNHGFTIPSVLNPFRVDRYNAVNKLLESKRLLIDRSCVKVIRDLEILAYKEATTLPDLSNDSTLGHASDGLGYAVWYLEPLQGPGVQPGLVDRRY